MTRISLLFGVAAMALGVLCGGQVQAADAGAAAAPAAVSDAKLYQQTVEKGIDYLLSKGQGADGSFDKSFGPGVAAICTTAILMHGRTPDDPAVAKSLKYLEGFIHDDGGIYSPSSPVKNYESSLAIQCFAAANADGRYAKLLKNADKFVKSLQRIGDAADFNYGGAGYNEKKKRADLSNTSFLLDALKATGNGPDDEAVKRALVFVSRCQNFENEKNSAPFAAKNPDNGFYYTPAAGGVSEAGKTDDGGLRSYGSMTYAGLKSMIFAGLTKDDPRVKAALDWIRKNYTLSSNPGMPGSHAAAQDHTQDGLYYYYQSFARALSALGMDEVVDAKGQTHDWRHDLLAALAERQKQDGSWVNSDPRFLEGNTNLVTAYALLSLAYAKPAK